MYSQALDATDYEYGSLANIKYISKQIESSRRCENLSFKHHEQVAKFPEEKQKVDNGLIIRIQNLVF
jgi:hypothetical protein